MKDLALRTARLRLRFHDETDVSFMMALNADPEVVRYTGNVALRDEDEAREIIARLAHQSEHGLGRMVVLDSATGERLGWCGLKLLEETREVDLGYRFFRHHWGKGYATEASWACLRYGFEVLGLERIVASVVPANVASVRVLEKLGFKRSAKTTCAEMPADLFVLTRDEHALRAIS